MELWYPKATVRLGPANKTWGKTTNIWGAVAHSSEGNRTGDYAVLDSQVRPRASWHLYNPRRGQMVQHYPFDDICWHTGARDAWGLIGIESEGFADEPLTASQNENLSQFFAWAAPNFGWAGLATFITLFEHNYFRATACPSGRILWETIISRALEIQEGVHMPTAEFEELREDITIIRGELADVARAAMGAVARLESQGGSFEAQSEDTSRRLLETIDRLNGVVCTTRATEAAIKQHFTTHNTGGGVIERAGVPILDALTKLVEKAETDRQAILADLALLRVILTEPEGGDSGEPIE